MNKDVLDYFNNDELATTVWENKYKFGGEQTPDDMFKRHIKEIVEIQVEFIQNNLEHITNNFEYLSEQGKTYFGGIISSIENAENLTEYLTKVFSRFINFDRIIFGGSMLQGIGNHSLYSSLSNCFVIGQPYDSYPGINKKADELVELMKRRGGVGLDLSTLRPSGAKIHNQASFSDGPVLFAQGYSNKTLEVAQSGRRGALMISLDIRHPDSLNFIIAKQDLNKLTGANISVKIPDDFMQAVMGQKDYILRFPVDCEFPIFNDTFIDSLKYNELTLIQGNNDFGPTHIKKIHAKELWETLVTCAWTTAEPGILFTGNWANGGTDFIYPQYRPVSTNPCFAGDMTIKTIDGYKTFLELNGKTDISFINKNGEIKKGRVWSNGIKPVYETKFYKNTHKPLKTTKDHTFMLQNGTEREISKSIKERIKAFAYTQNKTFSEYTKYGFIQGDGNLGRLNDATHLGLEVCIGEDDFDIAKLFGIEKEWLKNTDKRYSFRFNGFNDIFRQLDFCPNKLPERFLPKTFKTWELQNQLDFICGLFSANGSISKTANRISLKTSCKQLSEELKEFLESIGIQVTITNNPAQEIEFSNGIGHCKESYNVTISERESVITFAEKIGFVHQYKMQALLQIIDNRSPIVTSSSFLKNEEVFDFELFDDCHWGVVEGLIAHNCSEIPMQAYDACRLLSVNLYKLISDAFTPDASLITESSEIFYMQLIIADLLVSLELKYIDRIIDKISAGKDPEDLKQSEIDLWIKIKDTASKGRRCGCGFTGFGDMLASVNFKYNDSKETLDFAKHVFKTKMSSELDATTDLSLLFGAFDGFDIDLENESPYMNNVIKAEFPYQWEKMMGYGRRNVSWSTAAPTGSLSILTQTTSGIEPMFKPYYKRRKKCIIESDRVDYIDPNDGQKFSEFFVMHPKFIEWFTLNNQNPDKFTFQEQIKNWKSYLELLSESELNKIFEKSPWYGSTANDIPWNERISIQALVQKYTTHAISSTINLPENIAKDIIGNIYIESWMKGLKGNTVYREGSRNGILVASDAKSPKELIAQANILIKKRPTVLPAHYYNLKAGRKNYSIMIGFSNNKIFEMFIVSGLDNLPQTLDINDYIVGELVKDTKDWYNFVGDTFILRELTEMQHEEKLLSLMLSGLFRSQTPVEQVIKILDKSKPIAGTFTHRLIKILSKYAVEYAKGEKCPDCGTEVKHENGCVLCPSCGWTKC